MSKKNEYIISEKIVNTNLAAVLFQLIDGDE
jgi:hypothetical protein